MVNKLLCAFAAASLAAGAEPLTRGERDRAMSELHATRKMFLDVLAGVSKAQWEFKPGPDVWSIAQIADHITVSESELLGNVQKKILASPADPARRGSLKGNDERVLRVIPDRTQKRKAPEYLEPRGGWPERSALEAEFKKRRAATISYADTTTDDLRAHFTAHRAAGDLDAYQWLLVIAAHTSRHVQQINEVKAAPGFPKK